MTDEELTKRAIAQAEREGIIVTYAKDGKVFGHSENGVPYFHNEKAWMKWYEKNWKQEVADEDRCEKCGNYGDGWASVAYGPDPIGIFVMVKHERVYLSKSGDDWYEIENKNIPDHPKEVTWVGGFTNVFIIAGDKHNKNMATSHNGSSWEVANNGSKLQLME